MIHRLSIPVTLLRIPDSVEGEPKYRTPAHRFANVTYAGAVNAFCSRCGARGKANTKLVGRSRRLEVCVECRGEVSS